MKALGNLVIKTPEAYLEARRKIARLTTAVGYSDLQASRLSTIFSELIRAGREGRDCVHVSIDLDETSGRRGLSFRFRYGGSVPEVPNAFLFFDSFHIESERGASTTISGFSAFSNRDFEPTEPLIETLREMLRLPSMSELLEDLREMNRELTDSAEQIRVAKEAAEEASVSLQHRVDELAEARLAMLNVLEDLEDAKKELEATNRQIVDSIRYASRIQRAVLPGERVVEEIFPQCMVIWEPRDVVGGDVYWCRAWGEGHLLILGDCTGHGVPGAFMTLIANGALDQALQKAVPGDPADLIGHMHRLMQSWLGQDIGEGDSDDGIEVGVCYLPPGRERVMFAGARFSLFHFDPDEGFVEIVGDRKGIGYRALSHGAAFTNHVIDVLPARRFFLATDGMIDQVGGKKRRSFGKKRFARLVSDLSDVPLPELGKYFLRALSDHQGEEKRRDDVSIIAFSFNGASEC